MPVTFKCILRLLQNHPELFGASGRAPQSRSGLHGRPEDQRALFTSSVGLQAAPVARTRASFISACPLAGAVAHLQARPSSALFCLRTLAGSEAPDRVALFEPRLPVVSLVQFGHVLGDHVLIQAV